MGFLTHLFYTPIEENAIPNPADIFFFLAICAQWGYNDKRECMS
jgi:hypothetical protein